MLTPEDYQNYFQSGDLEHLVTPVQKAIREQWLSSISVPDVYHGCVRGAVTTVPTLLMKYQANKLSVRSVSTARYTIDIDDVRTYHPRSNLSTSLGATLEDLIHGALTTIYPGNIVKKTPMTPLEWGYELISTEADESKSTVVAGIIDLPNVYMRREAFMLEWFMYCDVAILEKCDERR